MSLRSLPAAQAFDRPEGLRWDPPSHALERWSATAALSEEPGTIGIMDVIGADSWTGEGVTAKRISGALRSIGTKPVTVSINSPGGDMFEGLAIYNLLREHPAEVTVKVMGLTDYITNSAAGYGYLSSGLKANNGSASSFGAGYANGDRLCFAYNPTSRNFWMGKVVGGAAVWGASGNPATGANPAFTSPAGTSMYPAYTVNGSGSSLTFAFGSGQQVATPPSGFLAFP